MSGGEVVFDIAGGYNADMWDDTILIKNYERAYQASRRELIERRKSGAKKRKNWGLGDPCRILHSADGLEYEGTIVKITARTAKVRLHGYNEEVEVQVGDLDSSLGQGEVEKQLNEALQDQMLEIEEEQFVGKISEGDYCRARWSLDDLVYEGIVQSVKQGRVRVKFIGYENEDTVEREAVFVSKGEDWREQQIEDSRYDLTEGDITEDIHKLIDENPEVFSDIHDISRFSNLSLEEITGSKAESSIKPTKEKAKEKTKSKSDNTKPKSVNSRKASNSTNSSKSNLILPDPLQFTGVNFDLPTVTQAGLVDPPALGGTPQFSLPSFSSAGGAFPPLLPPPPPPQLFAQTSGTSLQNEYLHSMLISWYMAGYHTGFYQSAAALNPTIPPNLPTVFPSTFPSVPACKQTNQPSSQPTKPDNSQATYSIPTSQQTNPANSQPSYPIPTSQQTNPANSQATYSIPTSQQTNPSSSQPSDLASINLPDFLSNQSFSPLIAHPRNNQNKQKRKKT